MQSTPNRDLTSDNRVLVLLIGAGLLLILLLALTLLDERITTAVPTSLWIALQTQAQAMGLPFTTDSKAYWYLARAGGIVAYLLLWLATCWGMVMSSKISKGVVSPAVTFALHEVLPILGVVFAALHALVLLGDTYIGFSLWQVLIPFTSPYEMLWTGLGSLAFYLSLALVMSFYLRRRISQKAWRTFHLSAYLAFVLALLHGLMAGTDSSTVVMKGLYLVTGGAALFLLYYRLLAYVPRTRNGRRRAD
jgi:predicted ferric reductase